MEIHNREITHMENVLRELIKELASPLKFDFTRIWVGMNSYGEYEIEIDGELWGNCYTYDEAEADIRALFKGIEIAGKGQI